MHWDLTGARVLTTEFIDGVKINDVEELRRRGVDMLDLDRKLVRGDGGGGGGGGGEGGGGGRGGGGGGGDGEELLRPFS